MDIKFLLYAFVILAIILIAWIIRLEIRMKTLLAGKNAKSLEDTILGIKTGVEELRLSQKNSDLRHADTDKRLRKSISRVETIRFNPFKGTGSGGNQSFVTVFSDEEGNGVVVSGLYARDNVSVYAKPIKTFSSEFNLSEEEKEVLSKIQK
jgi:hypothetical protein